MKKRVLIIDDSSYMRGKIRAMFKEEDFETAEADSGMKALQSSAAKPFDIILLDIIMPGMDGLKVLKAFMEQKPQTPVIVVTADIQESVARQCMTLGAKAVLHKPPKEEELLRTIRQVLSTDEGVLQ